MNWFTRLCRNLGLMVHHIRHPEGGEPRKRQVRSRTEQRRQGSVTLRRTTIEEIEFEADERGRRDDHP